MSTLNKSASYDDFILANTGSPPRDGFWGDLDDQSALFGGIPEGGTSGGDFNPHFDPRQGGSVCATPARGRCPYRNYPTNKFIRNALQWQFCGVLKIPSKEGGQIQLVPENTATRTGGQFNVVSIIISEKYDSKIRDTYSVVKIPRDYCIMTRDSILGLPENTSDFVLFQYKQFVNAYQECPSENKPYSQMWNFEEAQDGCGFYVMEYIPNEFEIPWEMHDSIEDIKQNSKKNAMFSQLESLIAIAWRNQIDIDLKPDNLRVRKNGVLTLIDFREKRSNCSDNLRVEYVSAIKRFTSNEAAIRHLASLLC